MAPAQVLKVAQYRKVLLATDFSEQAEKALVDAVRVAVRYGAELHVLHVDDEPAQQDKAGFDNHPHWDHSASKAQVSMEALGRGITEHYANTVLAVTPGSSASAGILGYAAEKSIDLIVVGTHGRRALSELFMGSVAQEVVRDSPIPVLAVGIQVAAETADSGRSCVLAPVDFSEGSTSALIHAGQLAAARDAQLIVIHVIDAAAGAEEQPAREALERLVAEAHLPIPAEVVVALGQPEDAVLDLAAKRNVGLIVIAAYGQSSTLDRLLYGSVSNRLFRSARCPVLVHHGRIVPAVPVEGLQEAEPA